MRGDASENIAGKIVVTPAEISDFLQIAALDRSVWAANKLADYIPDGEHVWRLWVEYSTVYVAKIDNNIVGVALMFLANDHNFLLLHKMFVTKEYRAQGIGRVLFKSIVAELDKRRADCLLTTDPVNGAMQKLCVAHGFNEKTLVKAYYGPDEDRFVIVRRFAIGAA